METVTDTLFQVDQQYQWYVMDGSCLQLRNAEYRGKFKTHLLTLCFFNYLKPTLIHA